MYATDSSTTGLHSNSSVPAKRRLLKPLGSERGANLIEMAFVVILMLSFIVGAVDLGFAYQHYGVVLNSSREGARLYSRLPCTSSNRLALQNAIQDAAVAEGAGGRVNILPQNVEIIPDPAMGCPSAGSTIEVGVRVQYDSQFGQLIGIGSIPISASTSMVYYGTDTSQSGS